LDLENASYFVLIEVIPKKQLLHFTTLVWNAILEGSIFPDRCYHIHEN